LPKGVIGLRCYWHFVRYWVISLKVLFALRALLVDISLKALLALCALLVVIYLKALLALCALFASRYLPKGVIYLKVLLALCALLVVIYLKVLLALCALLGSQHYNLYSKWHRHDRFLLRCGFNPMQICVIPFLAGCSFHYHLWTNHLWTKALLSMLICVIPFLSGCPLHYHPCLLRFVGDVSGCPFYYQLWINKINLRISSGNFLFHLV